MTAGVTYSPISTQTLGSAAASVTFSSIPSTYTDLILIAQPQKSTAGGGTIRMQFNSDTNTNYSSTALYGDGSSAGSDRAANVAFTRLAFWTGDSVGNVVIGNFQNYANTTTYKTVLSRMNNASGTTGSIVGLWRSTSAISTIYIYNDGGNFNTGSTFTLYGVTAA